MSGLASGCIVLSKLPPLPSALFEDVLAVQHSFKQTLRRPGRAGQSSRARDPTFSGLRAVRSTPQE